MSHELSISYGGAELALKFGNLPTATLLINGIERESVSSKESDITLKLSSTVQTDYEWHEFVEAIILYQTDMITASLRASKKTLKEISVKRGSAYE